MRASVLKSFIEGKLSAKELSKDLEGTTIQKSHDVFEHRMSDLKKDFEVKSNHLVLICDAVISGDLRPEQLSEIGFGMIASEYFMWDDNPDGDRVAETLHDWDSPEINYVLNIDTVKKFRHRLLTGEDIFTKDDLGSPKKHPNKL